tara:strand:+ start:4536 stop:5387 length:852 start_codon:yes stop_codon:yes gene_type:complete
MKNKNGFIYIMSNPSFTDNRIKIGRSKSDPSSFRKDELYSTGVPEPFRVEYFAFVEDYKSVELQIHKRLIDKRPNKNREFFTSSIAEAINTIRETAEIKFEEDFSENSPFGGEVKEFFWTNGQLQRRYRTNGKGDLHGVEEDFDHFGNKRNLKTYKNGKKHGLYEKYIAGLGDQTRKLEKNRLSCRGYNKDDVPDGPWEYFHENGQLKMRGNWKQFPPTNKLNQIRNRLEEEKEGLWEEFYEDGKLKIKTNFKQGKHHGLHEEFDEEGNLSVTKMYKNGEEIF